MRSAIPGGQFSVDGLSRNAKLARRVVALVVAGGEHGKDVTSASDPPSPMPSPRAGAVAPDPKASGKRPRINVRSIRLRSSRTLPGQS